MEVSLNMKRMISLLLAAALLLGLAACAAEDQGTGAAMGRFVESELTLPEDIFEVHAIRGAADGGLDLLAYMGNRESQYVDLKWYRSADGGVSWTQKDCPALEGVFNPMETNVAVEAAAWDASGRLYLYYKEYPEDSTAPALEAVAYLDDGGQMVPYPWPVPQPSDGSGLLDIRVAENGDILLGGWREVIQVDPATGAVKETYTPKDQSFGAVDGWDVVGNTLWMSEPDRLYSYDLTAGAEGEVITADTPTAMEMNYGQVYRAVAARADGVYYATDHGIFRAVPGSSVTQRLVDGNLSSLGTPSLSRIGLASTGEAFLLLGYDGEHFRLYGYRFDPTVPAQAERELRVWSLYDEPLIRQAIGAFQRTDPNVYVSYEPALTGEGGATREDALKALSTELLAGKGPDVLVLDGLPVDSYIQKGILADLSATVDPLITDGTLMKAVAETYRQEDGALYAVPSLFQVPLMHGESEGVTDLASLADWAEARLGTYVHPLYISTLEDYLGFFYPVRGAVEEAELRAFLTDLKRVYDLELQKPYGDGISNSNEGDFQFGALYWMAGSCGLNVGNLKQFENLYCAYQASLEEGRGTIAPLFGQSAFRPVTTLSVTSSSTNGEAARAFLAAVLGAQVQSAGVGAGLPVNAAALEAMAAYEREGSGGSFSYYAGGYTDAEGGEAHVDLRIDYPPLAWREEMVQLFQNLTTPLLYDETVLQLLLENTRDYFEGGKSLDETMAALMQKLSLYRSEQG